MRNPNETKPCGEEWHGRARMPIRWSAGWLTAAMLAGCVVSPPQALGTLEWDRIALPAPVSEKIVRIDVREGERVAAGTPLLRLDDTRSRAQLEAVRSQAQQQREALAELLAGPRQEAIAQARAALDAAIAQAADARAYYERLRPLGDRRLVAAADVDRARAVAGNAEAQVRSARQALLELERGTRSERLAQGKAALAAAEAQVADQQALLDKLVVTAPRPGRIDSLPYRLGDQAPVGAPLAVMLVGDAPYARVYVPEPIRAGIAVGDRALLRIEGDERRHEGRVRAIRGEPSFTPYYALTGEDAARLSYLAEIELGDDAADLPAGLPVRVEFPR